MIPETIRVSMPIAAWATGFVVAFLLGMGVGGILYGVLYRR